MSRPSTCPRCAGRRHRFDQARKVWIPCECLKSKQRDLRYRKAEIPARHLEADFRTFLKEHEVSSPRRLVQAAVTLKKGEHPASWVLLHGRRIADLSLATSLLLKSACDGGLDCRRVNLSTLIDAEFDKGRGDVVRATPVLAIEAGNEPTTNKWTRHVFEQAVTHRWAHGLFTVVLTTQDPSRLASRYKSGLLDDALRDYFDRVRVQAHE